MSNVKELDGISNHMIELGLGALAHANWHANYYSHENTHWAELSVLQAAHAAEILIKARIAQEHPLLIFEQLPKSQETSTLLSLQYLIEGGRTYQFIDLPDRLWATTGIKLPSIEHYRTFGKLRNSIQHFTPPPDRDIGQEATRFIYEIIDPFIHTCWDLYAIDYNEDPDPYIYLIPNLISRSIRFLVSPDLMENFNWLELDWPAEDKAYRHDMEARFNVANSNK